MLVWPRRPGLQPVEMVERLSGRRRALLRANVVALVVCGALLALAPAVQGAVVGPGLDPTTTSGGLAWARQNGTVVVRSGGGAEEVVIADAREPALSGELLAYRDATGIAVVRWQTGEQVAHVDGAVSLPALDWPRIAFVRDGGARRRLVLRNLATGGRTIVATVVEPTDLGRPSLRNGRLAWHVANRAGSRVVLLNLSTGRRRIVARSKVFLVSHPALHRRRIVWVEQRSGVSRLRLGWTWGGRARTLTSIQSRDVGFWTTALTPERAYMTRWSLLTRVATLHSRAY
jgi:hypothetical protein